MAIPPDAASTARRQIHRETLGAIAKQVAVFELAGARMANDPAAAAANRGDVGRGHRG